MIVKCIDCKNADWVMTPTGRIKKSSAGRCRAVLPKYPDVICVNERQVHVSKHAIWPDYEGECAVFEAKLAERQKQ